MKVRSNNRHDTSYLAGEEKRYKIFDKRYYLYEYYLRFAVKLKEKKDEKNDHILLCKG